MKKYVEDEIQNPKFKSIKHIFEYYCLYDYTDVDVIQILAKEIFIFLLSKDYNMSDIQNLLNVKIHSNSEKFIYTVKANNFISALWMCDYYPSDPLKVNDLNFFENKDRIFQFSKNKKLIIKNKNVRK